MDTSKFFYVHIEGRMALCYNKLMYTIFPDCMVDHSVRLGYDVPRDCNRIKIKNLNIFLKRCYVVKKV